MNEEEKDIYIKGKIKDGHIPEKIDNLFNNSIKIIENKGERQMEENSNLNMNQNNQNKPEKKKMSVALKRVLATAACLTVVAGGGNLYAMSQGYDNIFFLIKHVITGEDVRGKENILSDRDITISYRPIEISKGTQIQVNSLVIKDNAAKLKIKVDESGAEKSITPLEYKVKDENGTELCNYTSNHAKSLGNVTQYSEELILNGFKEDTKKLTLEIYNSNSEKIVDLEIDLENKEINVIGNQEELTKISEEELKHYLGAFATLSYKGTEYNRDFSKDAVEVENARKIIAALQIAEINNIDLYTGEKQDYDIGYNKVLDREKVNKMVESFTEIQFGAPIEKEEMQLDLEYWFYVSIVNNKVQYVDSGWVVGFEPTCLEVTDISYVNGIYNVTFKFCYSTESNKNFESVTTVEDLPVYEMSIGLILDEENEYSKYRVSTMSDATLVKAGTGNNNEDFNNTISDIQAQNIIQGFINVIAAHEGSTTEMLAIEEIKLAKREDLMQIHNTAERDNEGYMKTDIKYSDLKNKMLEYMTEELFETYSYGYKNVDGDLWMADMGASGLSYKIENIKVISSFENTITYEVARTMQWIDTSKTETIQYELQKNENGKYVVSAWGWQIKNREEGAQVLQNYLDLLSAYEGTPAHLLYKLNLMTEEEFNGIILGTNQYCKTDIKFSDYKEAMLNYVSESWFNEKFATLYNKSTDENEYLNFQHLGTSVGNIKVESITADDYLNSKYIAKVYDIHSDGVKGDNYNIKFTMEYNNDKKVISYCDK